MDPKGVGLMREMIVSKSWAQVAILVFAFGFFVLGFLAYRTYVAEPPIPAKVVDPSGITLFTGADITGGQQAFLRNGLMEFGSVYGHGAYLGPDFTTDYLHRAALIELDLLGGPRSERARDLAQLRAFGPFDFRRVPAVVQRGHGCVANGAPLVDGETFNHYPTHVGY